MHTFHGEVGPLCVLTQGLLRGREALLRTASWQYLYSVFAPFPRNPGSSHLGPEGKMIQNDSRVHDQKGVWLTPRWEHTGQVMLDSLVMYVTSIICTTGCRDDHSYPTPIYSDSVKHPAGGFRTGHQACLEVFISKVIAEEIGGFYKFTSQ